MQPFRPRATYGLLGAIAFVFVAELLLGAAGQIGWLVRLFVIDVDWLWRPWTLITSTLAHAPNNFMHILFNGLFLFFFGPLVERILGVRSYLALFFAAGALSGVAQVHLAQALGHGGGALGASGALMALFGVIIILLPRERILIYGIIPLPMWAAGIGYAALDVLGAFNPDSPIGNYAHLSGMALGLAFGLKLRMDFKRRGLRLMPG